MSDEAVERIMAAVDDENHEAHDENHETLHESIYGERTRPYNIRTVVEQVVGELQELASNSMKRESLLLTENAKLREEVEYLRECLAEISHGQP